MQSREVMQAKIAQALDARLDTMTKAGYEAFRQAIQKLGLDLVAWEHASAATRLGWQMATIEILDEGINMVFDVMQELKNG